MGIVLGWGSSTRWSYFSWGGATYGGTGESLELPDTLRLPDQPFRLRHDVQQRALVHGGRVYGEEIEPRDLVIEGKVLHDGDAAGHFAWLKQLRGILTRRDLDLRLSPDADYYITVAKLKEFPDAEAVAGSSRTFSRLRFALTAEDPFWYSDETATHQETPTGDLDFEIDTDTGTHHPEVYVWPVITITAPPAASVPSVLLRNDSDEGMQFTYADLGLKNGAQVVIDTRYGTVIRDGTNTIRYFRGDNPRLWPGVNSWHYEGAACTLDFSWRARWI